MSESFSTLLAILIAAHIFGDFIFQTKSIAAKKTTTLVLIKHSMTVAVISYILAGLWAAWLIPLGIFLSHLIVDPLKTKLNDQAYKSSSKIYVFLIDQAIHIAVIVAIAFIYARRFVSTDLFWIDILGMHYLTVLVLIAGLVLITKVGGIVIGMSVEQYWEQLPKVVQKQGLKDAGKVIGYLERFLIYIFILGDFPVGIGFLIAAKAVLRFGEAKSSENRMDREYFFIGTLMSFAYAIVISYGVYWYIGKI